MAEEGGGGALRELLAIFDLKVDEEGLKKGETAIDSLIGKVQQMVGALAAAFAVKELFEFAEAQAKVAHQIDRTAMMVGLSTDRIQELQFAARAMGEDAGAITGSLTRLQLTAHNNAAAFQKLGISVKDANGHAKSGDQIFIDLANKIKSIKDPGEQAAAVFALGGRRMLAMLPILQRGGEHMQELAEKQKMLGGVTKEGIEVSEKFEEATASQSQATIGLRDAISIQLTPILTWLTEKAAVAISYFRQIVSHLHLVQIALGILGGVGLYFAIQMIIAFAPFFLAAAAVLFLIGIIDDLVALFNGHGSVIGAAIDKMFGKGASTELVKDIKGIWTSIVDVIKDAYHWILKVAEKIAAVAGPVFKIAKVVGKAVGGAVTATSEFVGDTLARGNNLIKEVGADVDKTVAGPQQLQTPAMFKQQQAQMYAERSGKGGGGSVTNITKIEKVEANGTDTEALAKAIPKAIDDHHKMRNRQHAATHQIATAD